MIQKIQSNEYLKRFGNMTVAEKAEYQKRVGDWNKSYGPLLAPRMNDDAARFQNVIQCSTIWNDAECKAWTEGARLMTAMASTVDTWLPDMLYVKAAKRAIRQMFHTLNSELVKTETKAVKANPAPVAHLSEGGNEKTPKNDFNDVGPIHLVHENAEQQIIKSKTATPVRPKHIDQYVHLLPQKTQERAATVRGLLTELDMARENARKLVDSKSHPDKIAQWAKMATKLDEKIKSIYKELDSEWDKLVKEGRVTVDDLGNAHVSESKTPLSESSSEPESAITQKENQTPAGTDEGNAEDGQTKTDQSKRKDYLKKWLRETRTKNSPERQEQWKKNLKELLELGGEVTNSIKNAAKVYEIDIDKIINS